MSLRSRFLIPVIFFGGIAIIILIVATIQGEYKRAKTQLLESNRQFLAFYLQQEKAVLESIGEAVAQNSQIVQAISEGNRDQVYRELKTLWDSYQKEQKLVEMSLFRPSAFLWLDMSQPNLFGYDACDVRGDIVSISKSGEKDSHLHVCSTFAGLRAVIPIRQGNKVLAVLSVGKRLSDIPRQLSEKLGKKTLMFYDKTLFQNRLMASHLAEYSHFPEHAGYIVQSPFDKEESTSLLSEVNLSDTIQLIQVDGKKQLLSLYPLQDMAGEKIGYMGFLDSQHELLSGITHNALLIGFLALGGIATIYISLHLGAARTKRQIAFIAVIAERLSRFDFQVLKENRPTFSNNERDELKMLCQSLFLMGEELHQHIQALNKLNQELDLKVEEEVNKRQMQEQMLIQQSKMASMGEMIGMIAHQWRQPLHAISLASFSSLDLLDEQADFKENQETVRESTEMVAQNVRFMNETLEHFREFLRPSAEKSWFDLRAAISEVHRMIDPILHSYGVSVRFHDEVLQDDEKLECLGYPNEFKQVILNLFSNARDAIDAKNSQLDPLDRFDGFITVSFSKTSDLFLIGICDNGGGIPEKILERIFENRFSTKGSQGTGIGLYMSKTIIEANMGGRLWAENQEDGAMFWIELPRIPAKTS